MNIFKSVIVPFALLLISSTILANDISTSGGTVVETMDSGGYTYVRLQEDNRWVASTTFTVSVGDSVKYGNANEMGEFHSRTLNRTFKNILFTQSLEVVEQVDGDAHANSQMNTTMANDLGISKSAAMAVPVSGEITTLDGGKTIDTIHTDYQQLSGQKVAVRAKVMKVSKNILGKNWITLQDGTGKAPDNKLLATSTELAEIGDVVTAKGLVKTDVDLGSGYTYKVVLEEATFSK